MRKAVGIFEIVSGVLSMISAIVVMVAGSKIIEMIFDIVESEMVQGNVSIDIAALKSTLTGVFAASGIISLIVGIIMIVLGALSLGTKMGDKTVAILAIVLGISGGGLILLILGVCLLVNTNKANNEGTVATGDVNVTNASANDATVDAEIEEIKKKIELAKLKKEADKLNSEK